MIAIIRITYNDDGIASKSASLALVPSIEDAKEIILNELCRDFNSKWDSLQEAAKDLDNDLYDCHYDGSTFSWYDNGKGVTYIFSNFDTNKKEFQDL